MLTSNNGDYAAEGAALCKEAKRCVAPFNVVDQLAVIAHRFALKYFQKHYK
jgi:hypothetical protein